MNIDLHSFAISMITSFAVAFHCLALLQIELQISQSYRLVPSLYWYRANPSIHSSNLCITIQNVMDKLDCFHSPICNTVSHISNVIN